MTAPKARERLRDLFGRLERLPPAGSASEAIAQVRDSMERLGSGAAGARHDGESRPAKRPGIHRYRVGRLDVLAGENGSMEIRAGKDLEFSKPGADGKGLPGHARP
jgi:hypothetical protein